MTIATRRARPARPARPAALLLAALAAATIAAPAACTRPDRTAAGGSAATGAPAPRVAFEQDGVRLVLEATADDVLHLELAPAGAPFDPARPIVTTPMVAPRPGAAGDAAAAPPAVEHRPRGLATALLVADVDDRLCVTVTRRTGGERVTTACPTLDRAGAALTLEPPPGEADAYGLGQACVEPGLSGGTWAGRVRAPGGPFGNRMVDFDGGACGDTQIPVLHAIGWPARPFSIFLDDVRAQTWDLRRRPWRVTTPSRALRFYLLGAPTLAELRADYLDLTGRPPVPPRAAFGLWLSEYGYEDWAEAEEVVAELRKVGFPIDGVVLDLQWFGGIREGSDETAMGTLTFDPARFPDPARHIAALRERHGVGVILIEESYVGRALDEHRHLAEAGFLARTRAGEPVYLDQAPWWGKGGMIDWTSPRAADHWHDWKRQPLVELGVVGHWTDLGEPEQYDPEAVYHGVAGIGRDHAAVHNLYNLAWAESIARGYRRHRVARRPFILTRSGTAGIQRHGAAVWSGDLGSRFTTLAAQQRNHMHMSMSGVDYYGSDVGGFRREALPADQKEGELYTVWLADAALTEVPLRPHTFNLEERYETSPLRIGHRESNAAALRLRYELVPLMYSLAHRAHRTGEAVFPPLALAFPGDRTARALGDHKLIGGQLLAAMVIAPGQKERRVYLPAGTWYDVYSGARQDSRGQWVTVPLWRDRILRVPLFARAGAIIPLADVDAWTLNTAGQRAGGRRPAPELRARVYPSATPTRFTLVEDDGETVAYLRGEVRQTEIAQRREVGAVAVEIAAARGTYAGAPDQRAVALEVVGAADGVTGVSADGAELPRRADAAALEEAPGGWAVAGTSVLVRLPQGPVDRARRVVISLR